MVLNGIELVGRTTVRLIDMKPSNSPTFVVVALHYLSCRPFIFCMMEGWRIRCYMEPLEFFLNIVNVL